jgi:hypothetical protein
MSFDYQKRTLNLTKREITVLIEDASGQAKAVLGIFALQPQRTNGTQGS